VDRAVRSGRGAVLMDKSTEDVDAFDTSNLRRRAGPRLDSAAGTPRRMPGCGRAVLYIQPYLVGQQLFQVALGSDRHPGQALGPHAAHQRSAEALMFGARGVKGATWQVGPLPHGGRWFTVVMGVYLVVPPYRCRGGSPRRWPPPSCTSIAAPERRRTAAGQGPSRCRSGRAVASLARTRCVKRRDGIHG
jgi:hypothetical protein